MLRELELTFSTAVSALKRLSESREVKSSGSASTSMSSPPGVPDIAQALGPGRCCSAALREAKMQSRQYNAYRAEFEEGRLLESRDFEQPDAKTRWR